MDVKVKNVGHYLVYWPRPEKAVEDDHKEVAFQSLK